jgi:hypothetical protein
VAGEGWGVAKWWDRFWGAVWMVGSVLIAYATGKWMAANSAPADLGGLRYGLIAFSSLFGLLVGAFCLSLAVIGITTGIEYLLARAGFPLRPPQPSIVAIGPDLETAESAEPATKAAEPLAEASARHDATPAIQ